MAIPFFSPFRILIIFLLFALTGLAFIPLFQVDLLPSYTPPSLQITYSLPQSSPEIVEQQITSPLENVFSQLSNLKNIQSVSHDNQGRITLYFDKNAAMDFKRFEVASLIRQIHPRLPANASYPLISRTNTKKSEEMPFLIYTLNAPFTPLQIKKTAEDVLKPVLSNLEGVENIAIQGANDLQLVIEYNADKMLNYGISREQLREIIKEQSQNEHLGIYRGAAGQSFYIKIENGLTGLENLENLIIKQIPAADSANAQIIRLKNIAQVYREEQEATTYFRINGLNSITLAVYAEKGINKLNLAKETKRTLALLQKDMPRGYQLYLDYDDTEYLAKELIKIYYRSALSLFILLLLIFIIHRRLKYLFTLFSGIAVNLALSFLGIWLLGIEIHLYSLAGITISFGLIIDNAIVMLDHLNKKGNNKVFRALLGASLTTIAALCMIYLLPEEDKLNLLDFTQIIILNLAISLLIALYFTPALYQLLNSKNQIKPKSAAIQKLYIHSTIAQLRRQVFIFRYYSRFIRFLFRFRIIFNLSLLLAFGLPVFLLPSKIENWDLYNQTLGSETYQENIAPYINKILGGALRLFVLNVYEKSGYRNPQKTILYINAEMPYGTTSVQMNEIIVGVEKYLAQLKGLNKFVSRVYSGQKASISIYFDEKEEKSFLPYQLKSRLIDQSLDWGGVKWVIYGVGDGFSNSGGDNLTSFRVEMRGYNYNELEKLAEIFAKKLLIHKRIQQVNINERLSYEEKQSNEFVLNMQQQELALAQLQPYQILNALHFYAKPLNTSDYIFFQNALNPLFLISSEAIDFSNYQLHKEILQINKEKSIKLSHFSHLQFTKTNNAIHKEARQYIRIIGFDYYGSLQFGNKYLDKILLEMEAVMPEGYQSKKLTYNFNFQKTQREYALLLILLVVVFFICAILFESLLQPFWIILTIPLSFIGLFLAFALFDFYFDQGGYAAFILLGGLVVNASIFVINDLNNNKNKQANERKIIKAVMTKSFPILMTTLSTILGLVPFLTEGDSEVFWFSLAVGSCGGLLFSLIAVFVCLPVWVFQKRVIVSK